MIALKMNNLLLDSDSDFDDHKSVASDNIKEYKHKYKTMTKKKKNQAREKLFGHSYNDQYDKVKSRYLKTETSPE